MNVKEAAQRLEVSVSLVYRLVDEGRLTCLRVGLRGSRGKIMIRDSDIEGFLKMTEAATAKRYARR